MRAPTAAAAVLLLVALSACSAPSVGTTGDVGADDLAGTTAPSAGSATLADVNTHGRGESLVLVVGGVYGTREEAEAAVAASNRGELSGSYLASTNDFRVTAAYDDVRPAIGALGADGQLAADEWMAVSAFRTRAGAEQWVDQLHDMQSPAPAMVLQVVRSSGSSDIGLGQEANPDGSGAVIGPLPQQETYQR